MTDIVKLGFDDIVGVALGAREVETLSFGSNSVYEIDEGTFPYIKDNHILIIPKGALCLYGNLPTTDQRIRITNVRETVYNNTVISRPEFEGTGYFDYSELKVINIDDVGEVVFDDITYNYGASDSDTHSFWTNDILPVLYKTNSNVTPSSGNDTYLFKTTERPYYYCVEIDFSEISDADVVTGAIFNSYDILEFKTKSNASSYIIANLTCVITDSLVVPTRNNALSVYTCASKAYAYSNSVWTISKGTNKVTIPNTKKLYVWFFVKGGGNDTYSLKQCNFALINAKSYYNHYVPCCISKYGRYEIATNVILSQTSQNPAIWFMKVQENGMAEIAPRTLWNIATKVGSESDWTTTDKTLQNPNGYTETRTDSDYTYSFTLNNPTDLTSSTLDYTVTCVDGTKTGTMTRNSSRMGYFDGSNNSYKIQFYTSSGIGAFIKVQVCHHDNII